jgi:hypothetical protein
MEYINTDLSKPGLLEFPGKNQGMIPPFILLQLCLTKDRYPRSVFRNLLGPYCQHHSNQRIYYP